MRPIEWTSSLVQSQIGWIHQRIHTLLRHRLATGAGWLAAGQYLSAALNFFTNLLIARLLGPTNYGLVALAIAYPTLVWSFVGTKSVSVSTRYVAGFRATGEDEKLGAVVRLGYALDFAVSVLALILVGSTAWWVSRNFYHQQGVEWLMIAYAASFPFVSLAGSSWAVLLSWERFRLLSIFEVLHPAMKLALVGTFLLGGFGVWGAILGMAIAQAVIGLITAATATLLMYREGQGFWWRSSLKLVNPIRGELTSFFGWNYLFVTASGWLAQVPVMLLGSMRSPEEAGFYRLATSITTMGSYLESSAGRVAYPVLSARWQSEDRAKILTSLKRWTLLGGLPAGILLIALTLILPILIPLVFGPAYGPATPAAQLMMLGAAVGAVFFWLNSYYFASGLVKPWVLGYLAYGALAIVACWFIIPKLGVLGAALTTALGKVTFTLLMLILIKLRFSYGKSNP